MNLYYKYLIDIFSLMGHLSVYFKETSLKLICIVDFLLTYVGFFVQNAFIIDEYLTNE